MYISSFLQFSLIRFHGLYLGADLRLRNYQGLTAFDVIADYDEWIESGCFVGNDLSRLKGINKYSFR